MQLFSKHKCNECKRTIPTKFEKAVAYTVVFMGIFGFYMLGIGVYLLVTGGFDK